MLDRSSIFSFTGEVTPGEERNWRENGFPGEKNVFPADGSASQQRLQTSLGILSLWLVRR